MQSKLRCCGKHPCCARSALDFIPNPWVFAVRLHHWVQLTHAGTQSHSGGQEQFLPHLHSVEHSFPHLCKAISLSVHPELIPIKGAAIPWLHRNSCLSALTVAGSCSNYSKLKIKTSSRITRALPAAQHYHPSSCTKELFPDTGTKAALSPKSHKTITSIIKSNLLFFFPPDNYLLRKQERKLIVPNIFFSISAHL